MHEQKRSKTTSQPVCKHAGNLPDKHEKPVRSTTLQMHMPRHTVSIKEYIQWKPRRTQTMARTCISRRAGSLPRLAQNQPKWHLTNRSKATWDDVARSLDNRSGTGSGIRVKRSITRNHARNCQDTKPTNIRICYFYVKAPGLQHFTCSEKGFWWFLAVLVPGFPLSFFTPCRAWTPSRRASSAWEIPWWGSHRELAGSLSSCSPWPASVVGGLAGQLCGLEYKKHIRNIMDT